MKAVFKFLLAIALIFTISACNKDEPIVDFKDTPDDFLSDKYFDHLDIEIISIEGYEPDDGALQNLEVFLNERINKPKGISFVKRTIPSPVNHTYSITDIKNLEKDERTQYRKDHSLAAFIFYADADFSENVGDSKTLGLVYSRTSMVIFKKTIDEFSGGLGQVSTEKLETTVLFHEFGHIFGLVNNGTPMVQDHESSGNPGHCDNEDCLMYYESNSSDLLGILGNGDLPTLDQQCIQDLQANGGK